MIRISAEKFKKFVAVSLALTLVIISPGFVSYQVVAQTFSGGNIKGGRTGVGGRITGKIGGLSTNISGQSIKISPTSVSGVIPALNAVPQIQNVSNDRALAPASIPSQGVSLSGKNDSKSNTNDGGVKSGNKGVTQDQQEVVSGDQVSSEKAVDGQEAAEGAEAKETSKAVDTITALQENEDLQELAKPEGDKRGALTRFFDRFKKGKTNDEVVTNGETSISTTLEPAAENEAAVKTDVPAPAVKELKAEAIPQEAKDRYKQILKDIKSNKTLRAQSYQDRSAFNASEAGQFVTNENADISGWIEESQRELAVLEEEYPGIAKAAKSGLVAAVVRFVNNLKSKLSLKDFNRSEKAYIVGQAVFILAITVYLASLPLLVSAITGDTAMTGVARAVHYWVLGGASLFSGRIAQKLPMKKTLIGGSMTRGLIFATIGMMAMAFMGPGLWTPFLILVGMNALVVSLTHLVDLDSGGAAKVFDSDKKIEKAGYIYDFMFFGMLLFVPTLMGIPIDWMDANVGAGIGAGAGYVFFGILMGVATYIYAKHVKVIKEKVVEKVQLSWKTVTGAIRAAFSTKNGKIGGGIIALAPVAFVTIGGFAGMFAGFALAAAGIIGILHWETLKAMWGNQTVLSRSVMETFAYFVEDALFAVVLPTFAIDILMAGATGNGLLLAAATGGALLSSIILLSRAQKLQRRFGTFKFLAGLTVMASMAFIPSMALWAWPTLWVAFPAIMLMKFMAQPVRSRMRAMLQVAIKNDPNVNKHNENIFSLMTFMEVISAGAGGLAFAWVFKQGMNPASGLTLALGSMAAMKVVTMALIAIAVVYLGILLWVKLQFKKPSTQVHSAKGTASIGLEKVRSLISGISMVPAPDSPAAEITVVETEETPASEVAASESVEEAVTARGPPKTPRSFKNLPSRAIGTSRDKMASLLKSAKKRARASSKDARLVKVSLRLDYEGSKWVFIFHSKSAGQVIRVYEKRVRTADETEGTASPTLWGTQLTGTEGLEAAYSALKAAKHWFVPVRVEIVPKWKGSADYRFTNANDRQHTVTAADIAALTVTEIPEAVEETVSEAEPVVENEQAPQELPNPPPAEETKETADAPEPVSQTLFAKYGRAVGMAALAGSFAVFGSALPFIAQGAALIGLTVLAAKMVNYYEARMLARLAAEEAGTKGDEFTPEAEAEPILVPSEEKGQALEKLDGLAKTVETLTDINDQLDRSGTIQDRIAAGDMAGAKAEAAATQADLARIRNARKAFELIGEVRGFIEADKTKEASAKAEELQALMPQVEESLALARLEASLKRMGLRNFRNEVVEESTEGRPTVAILAPASVYKISMLQEGSSQASGDVLLILDPSWIIQENWLEAGQNQLYVTKGVYFDEDGNAVVAEYKVPRKVGYFGNFYTMGANDRADGEVLEKDLAAPMSNSLALEKITNDKLLTRLLLAAKGIAVPATVAFLLAAHPLLKVAQGIPKNDRVQAGEMPEGDTRRDEIQASVEKFLANYDGDEVVVKPSGPQFHSGRGVEFFSRNDMKGIIDHVIALSKDDWMTPDGSVLVDGRIAPPALYYQFGEDYNGKGKFASRGELFDLKIFKKDEIADTTPKQKKDWNLRVLVHRTPWGGAKTQGIFARAGAWGVPTTAEPADPEDAAAVVSIEDVIEALQEQHGLLKTDEEVADFIKSLEKMGEDTLMALDANEKDRVLEDRDAVNAQTDYIGLDVMVDYVDGKLIPMIIEINDHDSGGQWQLDQFYPGRAGESWRPWMATGLQKARREVLKGKRIVMVGAGYESKRFTLEKAKELGVEIILVDKGLTGINRVVAKILRLMSRAGLSFLSDNISLALNAIGFDVEEHWARDLVSDFIPRAKGEEAGTMINSMPQVIKALEKAGAVDGVATFWEDDVPNAAALAEHFGVPYHSVKGAWSVRSKKLTRSRLEEVGLPTPKSAVVNDQASLEAAIEKVGFPAVIKPVFGAEAQGVMRVDNAEEAQAAFETITSQVNTETDDIFKYGTELIMEQYLDGPEFDVDMVMQDGKAKFVSVTDNWPTREPHFLATGSNTPSRLADEIIEDIKQHFVAYAEGLGLTNGVVHLEGRYTADGPMLIEANGRMGGHYVANWNKAAYGRDFVEDTYMIAAGIPLGTYGPDEALMHLDGEFLIPNISGVLSTLELAEEGRTHENFYEFDLFKSQGETISVPPDGNERVGMLVAKGSSNKDAFAALQEIKTHLKIEVSQD